jgi:probable rRNA maturation factor
MLIVETNVAAGAWESTTDWTALATRSCAAALAQTPHAGLADSAAAIEVAVRLTDNVEGAALNLQYRYKDGATNVLSFPMVQADLLDGLANTDDGEILFGDIVLAAGVVTREAADKHIAAEVHTTHLIVHGMLHLLGYEHEDDAQAEHMEALETAACAALGLADPYAADPPPLAAQPPMAQQR